MSLERYMLREVDVERLKQLGFVKDNMTTPLYVELYKLYTSLLMQYLDKELNLQEQEKLLKEEPLIMKPIQEDKDSYQSLSNSEFLYIRNNLKIERMSKEYLQILKDRVREKNRLLDSVTEKIIQDTYREIITNKNYDEGTMINYGPSTSNFFAPNNHIILGIRFDPEYEKDNGKDDSWLELYRKRKMAIKRLIDLIEKNAKGKGIPLSVIEYNEATVTRSENEIKK